MSLRHQQIDSPLGPLVLTADATDHLTAVAFGAHRGTTDGGGILREAAEQLAAWFAGERTAFDLPTRAAGTPGQERVWAALREIPFGSTTTYGALGPARGVGAACGANPLLVVVPCHRVVGSTGRLTGYAGGLEAKRRLLVHEARIAGGAPGLDDDACWAAHLRRDRTLDGTFLMGVRTSGVYCRPSCGGRPHRENVVYVRDARAARRIGLRACLRCRPDEFETKAGSTTT